MDKSLTIIELQACRLLAAKGSVFCPLPSSFYVNSNSLVSLNEYFERDQNRYDQSSPSSQGDEQFVQLLTSHGPIVYCPGYFASVQEELSEKFYFVFIPKMLVTLPDPEHLFFKLEQYSEHFDRSEKDASLTLPPIKLPALTGLLLKVEGSSLCRADFEPVPERLLQDCPALADKRGVSHVQMVLHSSNPIRLYPGLVMLCMHCPVQMWFPRILDQILMAARQHEPNGSTWHVKCKYDITGFESSAQHSSASDKLNAWSLLSKFAQVTHSTKQTFAQLLSHPLSRPLVPYLPPALVDFVRSSPETDALMHEYPESAGQYLKRIISMPLSGFEPRQDSAADGQSTSLPAGIENDWQLVEIVPVSQPIQSQRQRHPICAEDWLSYFGNDGRLLDPSEDAIKELQSRVFFSGLETDIRPVAWKFLLGVYPWDSTEAEREAIDRRAEYCFRSLLSLWQAVLDPSVDEATLPEPGLLESLTAMKSCSANLEVTNAGDEHSDLSYAEKVKERFYRITKDVVRTDRTIPFFKTFKPQSTAITPTATEAESTSEPKDASPKVTDAESPELEQLGIEGLDSQTREEVEQHLESLKRVLMTFTMLEFDLGYVQGMNDLCAPFMVVMRNEADAFWCFGQWMKQCKQNFSKTQLPMHHQISMLARLLYFMDAELHQHFVSIGADNYFFAFRWILLRFKREFEFHDIGRLWEILWTRHLSPHFFFFIALAILQIHRPKLLELREFEDVLKYVNDLSTRLPLEQLLTRAELLFYDFEHRMTVLQQKGSCQDSLLPKENVERMDAVTDASKTFADKGPLNAGFKYLPEFYCKTLDESFDIIEQGWRGLLPLLPSKVSNTGR